MKAQTNRRFGSRHRPHATGRFPLRILTAVPICDGHDSAIITINLELVRHGIEVIYLGFHRSVRDIVRAAIQEDVRAIGLSSYNGGHVEFFGEVVGALRRAGAKDIDVFGGGGGTITPADAKLMKRRGVVEIFSAGTPLATMIDFVKSRYSASRKARRRRRDNAETSDRDLAGLLTSGERGGKVYTPDQETRTRTLGLTGPGGAGKTTLIDELVQRFLGAKPHGRIAILSHDPSLAGAGALLGDRATMIYAQDDRVFMRSLATRGKAGGLAPTTTRCLEIVKRSGFDLVILESVGVGQEAMPFAPRLVDRTVLVMSPDYGSRLQLHKIAMLDVADVVVLNKSDLPGAKTAAAEIEQRLRDNQRGQLLIATMAKRHRDAGVDRLFREVMP